MAQLKIDKREAARRQIDAAVRMLFNSEDVVGCATLVGAAYHILRDIAEVSGKSRSYNMFKAIIPPGKESKFWRIANSVPNFLKHADEDPEEVMDVDIDMWIDLTLLRSSFIYRDLGFELTPEMLALQILVAGSN